MYIYVCLHHHRHTDLSNAFQSNLGVVNRWLQCNESFIVLPNKNKFIYAIKKFIYAIIYAIKKLKQIILLSQNNFFNLFIWKSAGIYYNSKDS